MIRLTGLVNLQPLKEEEKWIQKETQTPNTLHEQRTRLAMRLRKLKEQNTLSEEQLAKIDELLEALDPVGEEDGDIDNDGDEDKTDQYLQNRRDAIGQAMATNEDVAGGMDSMEQDQEPVDDHEGSMAKADLLSIHKKSGELYNMISEDEELEGWVQAKITKAAEYITAVHNNMEYEKTKPTTIGNGEMSPADGGAMMNEAYTLEEFVSMMEEAGYSLEEGFMDTLGAVRDTAKGVRHAARFVGSAEKGGDAKSALKLVGQSAKHAYDQGGLANVGAMLKKIGRKDHVQDLLGRMRSGKPGSGSASSLKLKQVEKDAATGDLQKGAEVGVDPTTGANAFYNPLKEKMAQKPAPTPVPNPKPSDLKTPSRPKEPEAQYKKNISENTVARLQSLAGIEPTAVTNIPVETAEVVVEATLTEKAPEGWEATVKKMKKKKEIDNPWALAHWMKSKGYQPHAGKGKKD